MPEIKRVKGRKNWRVSRRKIYISLFLLVVTQSRGTNCSQARRKRRRHSRRDSIALPWIPLKYLCTRSRNEVASLSLLLAAAFQRTRSIFISFFEKSRTVAPFLRSDQYAWITELSVFFLTPLLSTPLYSFIFARSKKNYAHTCARAWRLLFCGARF